MPEQRASVRYSDDVEKRAPDEDGTIERIIASMARESEVTAGRYGHAVRASHAKGTGLLEGLPGFLRRGLLAEPRTHPAAVRLAQGPGELLSDGPSARCRTDARRPHVARPKRSLNRGRRAATVFHADGP